MLGLPHVASVTLLEYGDFCCSACRAVSPVVKEVGRRMGDRLCFVFRHFPEMAHPQAQRAAMAAEAAALQGAFWPMHDLLLAQPAVIDDRLLLSCAATLGLDVERFRQDLGEPTSALRIQCDRDEGFRAGVRVTPTFFSNGKLYDGSCELSSLLASVQREAGLR